MQNSFTKIVSLDDVNNGAMSDLFKIEFAKLLNNLADEDASWKTQREISIKLKVKLTSEERTSAVTMVEVAAKLAPPKPNEQVVYLDTDGRNVSAFSRKEAEQPELENIKPFQEAK